MHRDAKILQTFAERFAVIALTNLPNDYEGRKRVITSAIKAALISPESLLISEDSSPLLRTAPELLETLKALEEQVADFRAGRTWDADYVGLKQAHLKAKVAIQKAEA